MNESQAVRVWLSERIQRLRPRPGAAAAETPRRSVAIVTDSAAALPPEWVGGLMGDKSLTVVPMPVIIGEHVYADDDAELLTPMSLALASGTSVKTSRPSPGQFDRAYSDAAAAGYDEVVSLHISAKLSGTVDAARLAAERAALPVHVVDTETVGMGQGAAVQAAVAAAGDGAESAVIMAAAAAAAQNSSVYFYVPSLEQLRRGGRISLASTWLGTVLDIKPLLAVRNGMVVPLEKVRSAPKALARLQLVAREEIERLGAQHATVVIHHFGNEAQAMEFASALALSIPQLPAPTLTRLPAVLAAHAGLGVVAVVVAGGMSPPQGE